MGANVLVVIAHPDDEVLGCGGVIAKHSRDGDYVVVAILGQGKASRQSDQDVDSNNAEILALRKEAKRANEILGVRELIFHDFPDNLLDSIPLLNVVQYVERLKCKYRPDIVYTHHHADINIDHQQIFKAVITACRPIQGDQVSQIYSCEVPSSTEWQAPFAGVAFQPNTFIDISDTLDIKKQALAAYSSELRSYPHPRSVDAIDIIAKRWGTTVGFMAAEPFVLIRNISKTVGNGHRFVLRSANKDDEVDLLYWRNDKLARGMSDNHHVIGTVIHERWFKSKLANPSCSIYLAIGDMDNKFGVIRFDMLDTDCSRVSINIAPKFRGKGIGQELLKMGIDRYLRTNENVKNLLAMIKCENTVSENIFTQSGFSNRRDADVPGFFNLVYTRKNPLI